VPGRVLEPDAPADKGEHQLALAVSFGAHTGGVTRPVRAGRRLLRSQKYSIVANMLASVLVAVSGEVVAGKKLATCWVT
jgi:hypothetical protein